MFIITKEDIDLVKDQVNRQGDIRVSDQVSIQVYNQVWNQIYVNNNHKRY